MLDKSKPYGEVFGMAGIRYSQDGKYYRLDGTPFETQKETKTAKEPQPEEVQIPTNPTHATNDQLKAFLDSKGESWTNRKAAIAYISECNK